MWDNFNAPNNMSLESPKEMRKNGTEKIFEELIGEKISNLMKIIKPQIPEAQRNPITRNTTKTTARNIIIKTLKASNKENIKSSQRKKNVANK